MFIKTIKYLLVFILGSAFGIYSPDLFQGILDTKEKSGIVGLKILKGFLLEFQQKCGDFPSEEAGLEALVAPKLAGCNSEPLLPLIPNDPWDKKITYIRSNNYVLIINSNNDLEYVFKAHN